MLTTASITTDDLEVKLRMLSGGVRLTDAFLDAYGRPFLEKRLAYGNSDHIQISRAVPQEVYIGDGPLVCAIHLRPAASMELDHVDGGFVLRGGPDVPITFPLRPAFYDFELKSGTPVKNVITLYGGASLGVFVNGTCNLPSIGMSCQYCSIEPHHEGGVDFVQSVSPSLVRSAVARALEDEIAPIQQVMVNGGNFPDENRSFRHYARVVREARAAIDTSGRAVELHLIVYPPRDLGLIEELAGLGVSVAMNLETYDPELFARFCPGKAATIGQQHIIEALARGAAVLGSGQVFSILVGGLESADTAREGMAHLASLGVVPVVNTFHPDPGTPLATQPTPTRDEIYELGLVLTECYAGLDFDFTPFYWGCGRNALDTEAKLGLFT